jgi:hypothetical protein
MRLAPLWLMAALACCAAAPGAAVASSPALRWNAFGVEAYLDAEGRCMCASATPSRSRATGTVPNAYSACGPGNHSRSNACRASTAVSGALRPLVAGDVDRVDH